jgi:hypothetical protein
MLTRAYAHSEWQPEYWLSIGRTARLNFGPGTPEKDRMWDW